MTFRHSPEDPLPARQRGVRLEPLTTPEAITVALRKDPVLGANVRALSMGQMDEAFRGYDLLAEIDSLLEEVIEIEDDPTNPPATS